MVKQEAQHNTSLMKVAEHSYRMASQLEEVQEENRLMAQELVGQQVRRGAGVEAGWG